MTPDPDHTRPVEAGTFSFDPALAAAFGPDLTPGGFTLPPLLRDDPSELGTVVQPSSAEMPKAGAQRYQLHGEIARGGMGVVLKGRDPDLGRDLAFKVLRGELANKPAAVQRFVEEAQIGGQLQHPGVVPVYDLGRFADGRPYFAMKLVKGRTLADLFAARKSPADDRGRLLHTFLQVCQTVAYAHAKGVIHRDLKPSNVMVGGFGEVLVMDWGLAKVLPRGGIADEERATSRDRKGAGEEEPTVIHTARSGSGSGSETQAGSVMGTPAFMPPEQAGGEIDKLDERADVFGLGAMLCVLLTGQPPFVAATGDELRLMAVRGKLADAFTRLDACGADAELVTLCKRCLSVEREERPRNADAVASAVQHYLSGVEERARKAEVDRAAAEVESREQRKRRRVQLALAASVGLLMLGGGIVAWWQAREDARRSAEQARVNGRVEELVSASIDQAYRDLDSARWVDASRSLDRGEDAIRVGEWPETFRTAFDGARKDVEMVTALEGANLIGGEFAVGDVPMDFAKVADEYTRLFERYGIPVLTMEEADAVRLVRGSRIANHLAVALDDWAMARLMAENNKRVGGGIVTVDDTSLRLSSLAEKADPDPWRAQVRKAANALDVPQLCRLATDPAATGQLPPSVLRLARALDALGEDSIARELVSGARRRHPTDFWLNLYLASMCSKSGEDIAPVQALGYLRAAVTIRPQSPVARTHLAAVLSLFATNSEEIGAEVIHICTEVIQLAPKSEEAYVLLGRFLRERGRLTRAIQVLNAGKREVPESTDISEQLADAYAAVVERLKKKRGTPDHKVDYLREVVRTDPEDASSHNTLAWVLATGPDRLRSGQEAVRLATRACELTSWQNAADIDTLAAAHAETGDFGKAVEYQERALAVPDVDMRLDKSFRLRLALYEQKQPYRDPALAGRERLPPPREDK